MINSKDKLLDSAKTIAGVVSYTLGPNGRDVAVAAANGHIFTKDGYKTLLYMSKDPNLGAHDRIVVGSFLDAASQTVRLVGDGTSTATVLAMNLFTKMLELPKRNRPYLYGGIKQAVEDVTSLLEGKIEYPATNNSDHLVSLATISTNNNEEIGGLIGKLVHQVGGLGKIFVETKNQGFCTTEVQKGWFMDSGILKGDFFNQAGFMRYSSSMILIANYEVRDVKDIEKIISTWEGKCAAIAKVDPKSNKIPLIPLVIFCKDIVGDALAVLIHNQKLHKWPIGAVFMATMDQSREDMVADLIAYTGAKQEINPLKGNLIKDLAWDWFGMVDEAFADANKTVLKSKKNTDAHLASLEAIRDIEPTDEGKMYYATRIGQFTKGVGYFSVGAPTETAKEQLRDLVDDAVLAAQSALRSGMLPGGGKALSWAAEQLSTKKSPKSDIAFSEGYQIVLDACKAPALALANSVNLDEKEVGEICKYIAESEFNEVYDFKKMQNTTLKASGIYDAAMSPISALRAAMSIAWQLYNTENVVNLLK
jgi:chaperonin GroEL